MITFACDCGKRLQAEDHLAGRKAKCPFCERIVAIPTPEAAVADEAIGHEDPAETDAVPPPIFYPSEVIDAAPVAFAPDPVRTWHTPPPALEAKSRKTGPAKGEAEFGSSPREFVYVLLALALIPLVISLLNEQNDVRDRLIRRLNAETPAVAEKVETVLKSESASLESVLEVLPDHRLDDEAHLARDSSRHWAYAAIAINLFLAFAACCFAAERVPIRHLFAVGLFTGTIGILFLLAVQYVAAFAGGVPLRGGGIFMIFLAILKFIGFSYQAAEGDTGFLLSFIGFTCGVGLCEELCKALPLIGYYRRDANMGWRGACLWGLASGIGFGVSEGIMYSSDHYNGIFGPGIYVVRFVSCVALHAMWSASVGISIFRRQESIQGDIDWEHYSLSILRILAVPMILHGLYDTLLKKEMNAAALGVAVLSFVWLIWQVESARGVSRAAAMA